MIFSANERSLLVSASRDDKREMCAWSGRRSAASLPQPTWSSGLATAGYHQDDAAHQAKPAKDGRKRNRFLPLGSGLDRTDIENFFAFGVGEATVGQSDDPDNDQEDPDDPNWFHIRSRAGPGSN